MVGRVKRVLNVSLTPFATGLRETYKWYAKHTGDRKPDLVTDLKSDSSAPRRQRLRHVFITAQLAFCLVLIVTAGLFVRALGQAANVSPGFDVDRVDVATIDLGLAEYTDERGGRQPPPDARRRGGLQDRRGQDFRRPWE